MMKTQDIKDSFTLGVPILSIDAGILVFDSLYLNM